MIMRWWMRRRLLLVMLMSWLITMLRLSGIISRIMSCSRRRLALRISRRGSSMRRNGITITFPDSTSCTTTSISNTTATKCANASPNTLTRRRRSKISAGSWISSCWTRRRESVSIMIRRSICWNSLRPPPKTSPPTRSPGTANSSNHSIR